MSVTTTRPTRREERRSQTVREIKRLAMEQVSSGGPDALSLSGIVREMSMSPAAIYRYFTNREALLADLVVDSYDDLADFLAGIQSGDKSASDHLVEVLRGSRSWALRHPNAYRLIFQTSVGSGNDLAPERTIPASSRSMAVIVGALDAAAQQSGATAKPLEENAELADAVHQWAERTGLAGRSSAVLGLALMSWTRLHGIISLELGGHLSSTGISPALLFEAEIAAIVQQV